MITDGWIAYPRDPMPYAVFWVLTDPNADFEPAYGRLVEVWPDSA